MSPRQTIREKYPQLFVRDSGLTPAQLALPERRGDVVELLGHLQRELLYARRQADVARVRAGKRPIAWAGAPRYAKLRYRPLVFGSSPMAVSRSAVPFDDATGDGLAKRWGLPGGFHQLLGLTKLANLYPMSVSDMPLSARTESVRRDLLDAHVQSGLFTDRVVVLVGREAQRPFAYGDEFADHIGPLPRLVPGAREVLAMPDPHQSPRWRDEEGRLQGRRVLVRALLAARLPVARVHEGICTGLDSGKARSYAAALLPFDDRELADNAEHYMEAQALWSVGLTWTAAKEIPAEMATKYLSPHALISGSAVALWQDLCRVGLAPPRDLGAGAWWRDAQAGASLMYLDRGRALVVGPPDSPKRCVVLRLDGSIVEETWKPRRSDGLRWAEDYVAALGWDHPFVALDKQIAALRGDR